MFSCHFLAAKGFSPIKYVQAHRIEGGEQKLETDRLSVDEVAASVSYDDRASLRRIFKRNVG